MATKTKPVKAKSAPVENLGTETGSPAELDQASNNSVLYTLFKPSNSVVLNADDFETKSRPPVVPLKDMPAGSVLDFVLTGIIDSYRKDIKQPLMVGRAVNAEGVVTDQELCVPLQVSIANVLINRDWLEENGTITGAKATDVEENIDVINHRILIRFTGVRKNSAKFKNEDGTGKPFSVYDIKVSKKPVI